jgi:hypothetical protein
VFGKKNFASFGLSPLTQNMLLLALSLLSQRIECESTERDLVKIWFGNAGPARGVVEKYDFQVTHLCSGQGYKERSLAEQLAGTLYVDSGIDLEFAVDRPKFLHCSVDASSEDISLWTSIIREDYSFEYMAGSAHGVGLIGTSDNQEIRLVTHRHIEISYSEHSIISTEMKAINSSILPELGGTFEFYQSVSWKNLTAKEIDEISKKDVYIHDIHWLYPDINSAL